MTEALHQVQHITLVLINLPFSKIHIHYRNAYRVFCKQFLFYASFKWSYSGRAVFIYQNYTFYY